MKKIIKAVFLCLLFQGCLWAVATEDLKQLKATGYVNNFSKEFPNFLKPNEKEYLENKLSAFSKTNNGEIAIAIVDDFYGMETNQFSTALFNQWQVGNKGKDDGVLITIKPTQTGSGRAIYIITGYGAESRVTDFQAKSIIENKITPSFKSGAFFTGLNSGVDALIRLLNGGSLVAVAGDQLQDNRAMDLPGLLYAIFIVLIIFLSLNASRRSRSGLVDSLFLGSSTGSSFGGSGGGFGGFGGGFSGGGGAGGKW